MLSRLGWDPQWAAAFAALELVDHQPGRVVRTDRGAVLVATGTDTVHAPVRGAVAAPATGDWIALDAAGAVAAVLPRRGLLQRRDPDADVAQVLAANVDLAVVVCGLDRPVKPGRIERFLVLAWDGGAEPLVVLTKADLTEVDLGAALSAAYGSAAGAEVLLVSAATGEGIAELASRLQGRTAVLLGESGAGKSSLANALLGGEVQSTAAVRTGDAKGRHTTTARELMLLPDGGALVDTPGVRAVGLFADVDGEGMRRAFPEVERLAGGCRFGDCRHAGEPGCAVTAAVADGSLPTERLAAWHHYQRELAVLARRRDPLLRQAERRKWASRGREARAIARRKEG